MVSKLVKLHVGTLPENELHVQRFCETVWSLQSARSGAPLFHVEFPVWKPRARVGSLGIKGYLTSKAPNIVREKSTQHDGLDLTFWDELSLGTLEFQVACQ